jgi:Domain of unknown function (DUF4276)
MGEKRNRRTTMTQYTRLNIIAEGQTEREFAKETLSRYFESFGVLIDARCVMTSKNKHRTYRGGLLDYSKAKRDINNWISEEKSGQPYFSTMFDLYALPNDFPKFEESLKILDPYQRVEFLEKAMYEDIGHHKFIPYIQLHEFESLLLANPDLFLLEYMDAKEQVEQLKDIVMKHDNNPEKVNTGRETSPSKRIISLIPQYEGNKVNVGSVLAGIEGIDIQKIRCKHFADWVEKIEKINE